ncbi:MAG: hypothetical protein Q8912_04840 [Bacillota bacterium]|nr:hypothetical protein [Bacillota bacterium]
MTSDKGSLMEQIRSKYLSVYEGPSGNARKTMMYVTDLYQRIIWLINKWAISYKTVILIVLLTVLIQKQVS